MTYNDFQILSNEEYGLLSSHYASTKPYDRKTIVFQIYNDIHQCQITMLTQSNKYNVKILNAMKTTKDLLNKTFDNLTSLFDFNVPENQTFKTLSLFELIRKLISTTSKITKWSQNEQKEYYKSFAQKTTLEFLSTIETIISALAESNIYMFRHM